MRRPIVSLSLAVVFLAWAAPATPAQSAASDEGLCRLLTVKEVRTALGKGKWQIAKDGDVPDQCYMHNGLLDRKSRAFSMRLLASNEANQRDFRDGLLSSGARELTVAGFPAVQDRRDAVAIFFPDPWDILQLSPVGYDGDDVSKGIRQLAELAAARYASAGAPAPSTGTSTAPASACDLLTAEEVSAALGEEMTAEAMPLACSYHGDTGGGSLTGLTMGVSRGTDAVAGIEQIRALGWPETTVGGLPALHAPTEEVSSGLSRSMVAVIPDDSSVLVLSADAPAEVDVAAAVLALAALAVPRLGSIPLPSAAPVSPAPSPAASAAARTGLAALFPAEVGGSPTNIDREFSGQEFLAQIVNHEPMEDRVTKALRRRDRSVRDLSFVLGSTSSGSVVAAFQVKGGAIRPFVNVLLESLAMERTGQDVPATSVAGKEVFEVLGGFLIGGQGVAYPKDDVLWIVFSFGDEQTEIFSKLP
jgi:hypothetical protein